MIQLDSLALKIKIDDAKFEIDLLDQTLLPHQEVWLKIESLDQMIEAIQSLRVRGAPLIGVVASFMVAKAAFEKQTKENVLVAAQKLYEARPTAVNLMICIDRMTKQIKQNYSIDSVVSLAVQIFNEDVQLCEKMSLLGSELIKDGDQILTHCNTGGLATAGVGTALGVIRKAFEQGKKIHVYIDETRPLLQGGRLTAWELTKLGIPCTLITDNMAAQLMSLGKIDKVFVGSDRIAVNGDFANKIGTYGVAVSASYHKIPFYVVAPYTTVDSTCLSGKEIPIEQRKPEEVKGYMDVQWAPKSVAVYNPAFDVTPKELVTGWVLDKAIYNKEDVSKGVLKLC